MKCALCSAELKWYDINFSESVLLCGEPSCPYPFGYAEPTVANKEERSLYEKSYASIAPEAPVAPAAFAIDLADVRVEPNAKEGIRERVESIARHAKRRPNVQIQNPALVKRLRLLSSFAGRRKNAKMSPPPPFGAEAADEERLGNDSSANPQSEPDSADPLKDINWDETQLLSDVEFDDSFIESLLS